MTTHFGGVASSTLTRDRAVLAGINDHGSWALVHATGALRSNREFVLEALARDGNSLLYAADSLKMDKEVVLAAVEQNGFAFRFASEDLRADRSFALQAVKCNSNAMLFASPELREDRDFVLEAVIAGCSLEYVSAPLRTWCLKRESLLERMNHAIDVGDVVGLSQAIRDASSHGLPEFDIKAARMALAKLVKYSEVDSLWEPLKPSGSLQLAPVALVKGTWLTQLHRRGGRLPRRQELPPEAIWNGEELRVDAAQYQSEARQRRPHQVVVISHCWLRREHPDPHGEQLKTISEVVEQRLYERGPGVDLAIFLDYCSLFQEPRSPEEAAAFLASMNSVSVWYAHEKTEKWLLTQTPSTCSLPLPEADCAVAPLASALAGTEAEASIVPAYAERGWTHFECAIAELLACEGRTRSLLLDLGKAGDCGWADLRWRCSAKQAPPRVPEVFCRELAAKRLSEPADLEVLQDAYRLTFGEVSASTKLLVYCDLDWGDEEACSLAAAVRHFKLLESIELEGNIIGDAGASELFEAFASCPVLHHVVMRGNRVGDEGAKQIARWLPECKGMKALDLSFNLIGNTGASHLTSMFEMHSHKTFRELRLNSNDIGTFVKEKLRAAVEASQGPSFTLRL